MIEMMSICILLTIVAFISYSHIIVHPVFRSMCSDLRHEADFIKR